LENDNLTPNREAPIRVLLARAVQRARGSLLWERLWPALATFAMALGLFLTFSWAGLWLVLPPLGRVIGLVVFGLLIIATALPLIRLRVPSLHDGLRRLDRMSGTTHRPATTVVDRIAANDHDPIAQALWQARQTVRTTFTLSPSTGSTSGAPLIQSPVFSAGFMQPAVATMAPSARADLMNFLLLFEPIA